MKLFQVIRMMRIFMIVHVSYHFSLSRYEWKFYLKEILFLFVEPVSCSRNHNRRGTTASSFASSIVNNLATQPCELVLR
jgi:hypothetical protein